MITLVLDIDPYILRAQNGKTREHDIVLVGRNLRKVSIKQ
jgi:hypothetical protein